MYRLGSGPQLPAPALKKTPITEQFSVFPDQAKQKTSSSGVDTIVEVLVSLENPADEIKPGFTAKAKITTAEKEHVVILPYEAIQAEEDGTEYVLTIENNRAVEA